MNTRTQLISHAVFSQMLMNGHASAGGDDIDPLPAVKIFTPDAGATWLLTEIDPDDEDRAFGLCDLGLGMPELGWVRFSELEALGGKLGLPAEVDLHFIATRPLSKFAEDARRVRQIAA
jgi:hypothetical protein